MKFIPLKTRSIWFRYSSMGLELGLSVLLGLWIGKALDDWLGTDPWGLILFLIFGMVAGYRSVFRMWRKILAENQQKTSSEGGG